MACMSPRTASEVRQEAAQARFPSHTRDPIWRVSEQSFLGFSLSTSRTSHGKYSNDRSYRGYGSAEARGERQHGLGSNADE